MTGATKSFAKMATPTRLNFDDGSRIMALSNGKAADFSQDSESAGQASRSSGSAQPSTTPRGSQSLEEYYEIGSIATSIVAQLRLCDEAARPKRDDSFLCRVALQFPDSMIQRKD